VTAQADSYCGVTGRTFQLYSLWDSLADVITAPLSLLEKLHWQSLHIHKQSKSDTLEFNMPWAYRSLSHLSSVIYVNDCRYTLYKSTVSGSVPVPFLIYYLKYLYIKVLFLSVYCLFSSLLLGCSCWLSICLEFYVNKILTIRFCSFLILDSNSDSVFIIKWGHCHYNLKHLSLYTDCMLYICLKK